MHNSVDMANQRTGIAFSPEDRKLIAEIQKVLAKEQGPVSAAAAIRYALRQTVAALKKGK